MGVWSRQDGSPVSRFRFRALHGTGRTKVSRYTLTIADRLPIRPVSIVLYSADQPEPRHVHVQRDEFEAKYWLDPVRLERSRGFGPSELRRIQALIVENETILLRAWHDYFES